MLRSCLAMMLCSVTSFDEWDAMMRDEPFYAIISGFSPDDIPGVGTFYDFQDRLLQRASQPRTVERFSHWLRTQCDKADHHKRERQRLRFS
jgi:hypothetical protein